jgi:hypothetical protein
MAIAQQQQEESTNKHRNQAVSYKVGDKVWLDLRNVKTDRKSKKLDSKNAKYTVTKVIGSHSFELDVPKGIHPVFHSKLLRPAASDPFPSQVQSDYQPPGRILNDESMYDVEKILKERIKKGKKQFYVKWIGYQRPDWNDASNFEDTLAFAEYKTKALVIRKRGVL